MPLRNGPQGYGLVTKTLHWLTVLAISRSSPSGTPWTTTVRCGAPTATRPVRTWSGGDTSDAEEDRLDRIEDECEQQQDAREDAAENPVDTAFGDLGDGGIFDGGLTLPEWHVLLGLTILAIAVLRVVWRVTTPLPPWSEALSRGQQAFVAATEKVLLALLFVVPSTGLLLVYGEDDWLPVHVAAHIAFFVTLAGHLSVTLRPRILPRML